MRNRVRLLRFTPNKSALEYKLWKKCQIKCEIVTFCKSNSIMVLGIAKKDLGKCFPNRQKLSCGGLKEKDWYISVLLSGQFALNWCATPSFLSLLASHSLSSTQGAHLSVFFFAFSPSAFLLYFTVLLKGTLEGSWKGPHVDMHWASSRLTLCPYRRCSLNCVLWDWIDTVFGVRERLSPSLDKWGSNLGLNKWMGQSKLKLSAYIHSQLSSMFKDKD